MVAGKLHHVELGFHLVDKGDMQNNCADIAAEHNLGGGSVNEELVVLLDRQHLNEDNHN